MKRYDPELSPVPAEWLDLNEQIRNHLVEKYHRAKGIKSPNLKVHAIFHTIVENQIAENLESVVRAMARLRAGGLSRHEAIHAVGSVLAEHIYDLFHDKADEKSSSAVYNAAIERLTVRRWRGG